MGVGTKGAGEERPVLNVTDNNQEVVQNGLRGSFWGHVLVAICACLLTIAIVGSAVFLVYKLQVQRELRGHVRTVVASLQNRTPEEIAERIAEVKTHPKLAGMVLPEVLSSLKDSKSEQQQCSAIEVLRVFVNHRQVEKALFRLHRDSREGVAASAVAALGDLQPPERAAEVLGLCLDDGSAGAVVDAVIDEACAGLLRLGEPGRLALEKRLATLSVERRVWLVGYVCAAGGPFRQAWLAMLRHDPDERVREVAERAGAGPTEQKEAPSKT